MHIISTGNWGSRPPQCSKLGNNQMDVLGSVVPQKKQQNNTPAGKERVEVREEADKKQIDEK